MRKPLRDNIAEGRRRGFFLNCSEYTPEVTGVVIPIVAEKREGTNQMYDLLKGIRVLDLTSVILGPLATQHLGDFGADVIKVEPPTGDIFRHVQPARSKGMGAGYLAFNRNKRSIGLNLKDPADHAIFLHLLEGADVLVHNMRPIAAKKLGLDPEAVRTRHPHIVYCVSTGYGSRGRNANLPAYDDIIQAACGVAHLNRESSGAPRFLPTVLCDKVGGLHLAMAVLAGVVQQAKTGRGCLIEAPMFEGLVSFLMAEHLAGESFRPAQGSIGYERLLSEQRKPFATQDGYIAVMPYNGEHWACFLNLIGRADLAAANWVQDAAERRQKYRPTLCHYCRCHARAHNSRLDGSVKKSGHTLCPRQLSRRAVGGSTSA